MRVLLDENMPHKLRPVLIGHEVFTVAYMRWAGIKNGALIALAEEDGFEVLLTADQGLYYQQDRQRRKIALVCLTAHKWEIIALYVAKIAAAVDAATPGSFQVVECGEFTRR